MEKIYASLVKKRLRALDDNSDKPSVPKEFREAVRKLLENDETEAEEL